MAVTAQWYGQAVLGQVSGTDDRRVDWENDTIKVALLDSGYSPDHDADEFFADVSADEIEGAGYTAGGTTLASTTATYDAASNTVRLDAEDVQWSEATITAAYAVVYKDTGEAATSPLMGYVDFDSEEAVSSGILKIEWDATDGVLRLVVPPGG